MKTPFTQQHKPKKLRHADITNLRAVGFDWDETLYDIDRTSPGYYKLMAEDGWNAVKKAYIAPSSISEEMELKVTALIEDFDRSAKHTSKEQKALAESIYRVCDIQTPPLEDFQKTFATAYDHCRETEAFITARNGHLKPGTLETLNFLKENDIPYFIATNSPQQAVRSVFKILLKKANASHLLSDAEIDRVVLGDKANHGRKPDAKILFDGFRAIGIENIDRGCYYVGNSFQSDMIAALRCGCRPILFSGEELAAGNAAAGAKIFNLAEDDGLNGRPATAIGSFSRIVEFRKEDGESVRYSKCTVYQRDASGEPVPESRKAVFFKESELEKFYSDTQTLSEKERATLKLGNDLWDKEHGLIVHIERKRLNVYPIEFEGDPSHPEDAKIEKLQSIPAVHDQRELLALFQVRVLEADAINARHHKGIMPTFSGSEYRSGLAR